VARSSTSAICGALWQRAEGPYVPLGPRATVLPLAGRLAAEHPDQADEGTHDEEESGQLAFELAA
jgi:hypothetical protein